MTEQNNTHTHAQREREREKERIFEHSISFTGESLLSLMTSS